MIGKVSLRDPVAAFDHLSQALWTSGAKNFISNGHRENDGTVSKICRFDKSDCRVCRGLFGCPDRFF